MLKIKRVFPNNPNVFVGFAAIRVLTALYLLIMITRSFIHLFAQDGGAQSIAGIDTSVSGGDNIIAIFHQWGAIQFILAAFLLLLLLRYPGFTPLILLTLALDPIMRIVAGQIKPLTTAGTPPGERFNLPALLLLTTLYIASLIERGDEKK